MTEKTEIQKNMSGNLNEKKTAHLPSQQQNTDLKMILFKNEEKQFKKDEIGIIAHDRYYVYDSATLKDLSQIIDQNQDIQSVAVVNTQKHTIGNISRKHLFQVLGKAYGRELFGNKTVQKIMEPVESFDVHENLFQVAAHLKNKLKEKNDFYFNLCENGIFHAAFSSRDLLIHLSELTQRTIEHQNGDYYLTSLLITPLIQNFVPCPDVDIQIYHNQKKKFEFRGKNSEIGGDISIAAQIELRGKQYPVFINSDAMGKSLQGAGGALVTGILFNNMIERNRNNEREREQSPEQWIHEAYHEFQKAFELFDGSMLISGIIGIIDTEKDEIIFINQEHPFLVRYRHNTAEFAENNEKMGRKFGTIGFGSMEIQKISLKPGDILFTGSDGRDDVKTPHPELPDFMVMNEDETLFLKHVESGHGIMEKVVENVVNSGELADDFSLLRIAYKEDHVIEPEFEELEQSENKVETTDNHLPDIKEIKKRVKKKIKNKKYDKAIEFLLPLTGRYQNDKDRFYICYYLGFCYIKIKNFNEGLKYWEKAIEIEPYHDKLNENIREIKEKIK